MECRLALVNRVPQDTVAAQYLHGSRLEKKEKNEEKYSPGMHNRHAQMPPPAEEGGEVVGGFSWVGHCLPAPSHPSLGQSLLLPGFKVGWWLQTDTITLIRYKVHSSWY